MAENGELRADVQDALNASYDQWRLGVFIPSRIEEALHDGESVLAIAACHDGNKAGALFVTDERLVLLTGVLRERSEDWRLAAVDHIRWDHRELIVLAGNYERSFSKVNKHSGEAIIQAVRTAQALPTRVTDINAVGEPADPLDTLERLARLHEAGAITDLEYETKKAQLLGDI